MHSHIACLVALTTTMLTTTQGHMIMKTPTPFGKSTLNNSPLAADGSDFPCKQRAGVYAAEGASNTMAIGAPQTLSFIGSAVHGGGSCQISLTTDKTPSKSTKWQVIHSIEGGCPAKSADGNLPDGSNDSDTYTFAIPDGIAPGEYVLAWTWFNRIGNREMYMNCAPVTVTGGKTKRSIERRKEATLGFTKRDSFPGMFLANIGNGCTTVDSKDVIFPDPGSSLEKDGVASNLAAPSGNCGASVAAPAGTSGAGSAPTSASTPAGAASSGSSSGSSTAATAASTPTAAPSAASSPAVASSPVSGGAGATPSAAPSAASSPAAAAPSSGSGSGSSTGGSTGGSTAGGLSGACSTEGTWNCLGGTSFQRCASGNWSPVQPMPAGVKCNPGQSQDLAMNAAKH